MKVAILSTVYKNHYLKFLNISKSHKDRKGFINNFLEHSSSHLFYWKTYLLKYGFTVEYFATGMSHVNFYWNKINSNSENNMSEDHIVLKQVMLYKPDILFVLSPCYYLKYLNSIRTQVPSIKKLVAWYGADQGNEKQTFSNFDLILTNSQVYCNKLSDFNFNVKVLRHSFEKTVYHKIINLNSKKNLARKNKFTFIGTTGIESLEHNDRLNYLYSLCKSIKIDLFSDEKPYRKTFKQSYLEKRLKISKTISRLLGSHCIEPFTSWSNPNISPKFPEITDKSILNCLSSGVYGVDMLEKLSIYALCFNFHNHSTGDTACNMRLFESTGMGCCLLTDYKSDIKSLFEPDREIVTYKSADEAVSKARYLLDNPDETEKIARAGQKRTFSEHSTAKQAEELASHFEMLKN